MTTLYHSDPSTGEIFETCEVSTPEEKEHKMSAAGGYWFETPRWHRNPRPHGFDPSNPYEKPVSTPYQEFPRLMHKREGSGSNAKWRTLQVKDEAAKQVALKGGYLLVPNEAQHEQMIGATA